MGLTRLDAVTEVAHDILDGLVSFTGERESLASSPDLVADQAPCSVLMVRHYVPKHWSLTVAEGLERVRESAGLTTSPEE